MMGMNKMSNEHGFATVFALGVLAFIIIMVAFSSLGSNILHLATKQQKSMQATYAAEVGMRASTLILNNSIIAKSGSIPAVQYAIPSSLTTSPPTPYYIGAVNTDGSANNNVYYTVSVTSPAIPTGPATLLYTLTVVGHGEDGSTKTLIGQYYATIASSTSTATTKWALLSGGTVTGYNNAVTNNTYSSYLVGSTQAAVTASWMTPVTKVNSSSVNLSMLPDSFFNSSLYNTSAWNGHDQNKIDSNTSSHITPGSYYINGAFEIDEPINTTGTVLIYATGTVNVNYTLTGNFIIISEQGINVNGSGALLAGNIQLYSKGYMHLSGPGITGNGIYKGIFMTQANLEIDGTSTYNKAFIYAGGTANFYNSTIYGGIYVQGNVNIDGCTLIYDQTAIPSTIPPTI